MSEKILIASDSTTDLSEELIQQYNIRVLPLGVTLGDHTYLDGKEINPDRIYEYYDRHGELPHTSAINVSQFLDFFAECSKEYDSVIFFTISSQMSSTYNNARIAAEEYENIYVIDTANLSTGGGLLALKAADMAKAGKSAAEIAEACEDLKKKVDASFVVDTLEYLRKGGRCTAVEAFSAGLLHIKPCIRVRNGKMSVAKKYRGKLSHVLKDYVHDVLPEKEDADPEYVFITHSGCEEALVREIYEEVRQTGLFRNIFITRAGCTVSSHCGPNTLGVLFIHRNEI